MPAIRPRLPRPSLSSCLLTSSTLSLARRGDALAAGFQDIGVLRPAARHRIDHRDLALDDLVVEAGVGDTSSWRCRASCPSGRWMPPIFAICSNCSRMSESRTDPCASAQRCARPFRRRYWRRLFNQRHHVAHTPRIRPAIRLGMKIFRAGLPAPRAAARQPIENATKLFLTDCRTIPFFAALLILETPLRGSSG